MQLVNSPHQREVVNLERRRDRAAIQSAIDGFICHALGPQEDQT
jgi:hypothetical protein